jgi:hypothetical protein
MRVFAKARIRVVLVVAGIILVCGQAVAQPVSLLRSESDIGRLEELFLDRFMAGDFIEAFGLFRSSVSALSGEEIDGLLGSTTRQLAGLADAYGPPIDAVQAVREVIGDVLIRRSYVLRYEALPLRAWFVYYWNGNAWRLTYFGWDDQYIELFTE